MLEERGGHDHWTDYFRVLLDTVPKAVSQSEAMRALVTDVLSVPITILLGLHTVLGDSLHTRTRIVVHLVGTAKMEVTQRARYEELFHHLPQLQELRLCFVGPSVSSGADGITMRAGATPALRDEVQDPDWSLCASCVRQGRACIQSFHVATYHTWHTCMATALAPDLVVCLHAGLHAEAISWAPSLQTLLAASYPVLVTSYNSTESRADLAVVVKQSQKMSKEKLKLKLLVPPSPNPFRGLSPHPESFKVDHFYFTNSEIFVFRAERDAH